LEWDINDAYRIASETPDDFDANFYGKDLKDVAYFMEYDVRTLSESTERANKGLIKDLKENFEEYQGLKEQARHDFANFAADKIYFNGVPLKEAFPESEAWFFAHYNPKATSVSQMFAVPQFGLQLQEFVPEEPVFFDDEYYQWAVYEPTQELDFDEWTAEGDEYFESLEELQAPARFEVGFDLNDLRAWAESREEIYRALDERLAGATEEYLSQREIADQEFVRSIEQYFKDGKAADEETFQWAVDYVFDNISVDGTPLSANGVPTVELAQVKASSSFSYGYLAFGGIAVAGAAVFMSSKKTTKHSAIESLLV